MPNHIYGYLSVQGDPAGVREFILDYAKTKPIGIYLIPKEELTNFDQYLLPKKDHVCFEITDHPDGNQAKYFATGHDYPHDTPMTLPHLGDERVSILAEFLKDLMSHENVEHLVVTINACEKIEFYSMVSLQDFRSMLGQDLSNGVPPNKIYKVVKYEIIN